MQLPVLFGKYQLEKFLGGGMSQVYKATDTVLGRTVAVKILTDEGARDEDSKKRFLLEARMSGSIIHDNIIRIHDYGELDGRPFIVMEFLVGEDLRSAITNASIPDLKGKLDVMRQAARALRHVHEQNIIHRDIKPDNLHIDTAGRVRLMDFGIAKAANLSLTKTGFALGTPYYMAPEQVLGKPVTPAADIYAWGLVLYETLTSQKPVSGDTIEVLFYQILHHPLDLTPVAQQPGVPARLVRLIERCAAKKPEERPANFAEVIIELDSIIANLGSPEPEVPQTLPYSATQAATAVHPLTTQLQSNATVGLPSPANVQPPTPQKSMAPVMAGVGALVIAGVLAFVFWPKSPAPDPQPGKTGGDKGFVLPHVYVDPIAGAEMILIDSGFFKFDKEGRQEFFDSYYIDKTEVTKRQWTKYAEAKGIPGPEGSPDEPMVEITIAEARDFANWAGKLLPSGRQWEKAARGTDGRKYPWGNNETGWKANLAGSLDQVQPASAELGSGPTGVLNIAGNVAEYVDERRPPSVAFLQFLKTKKVSLPEGTELYTIRGGSFKTPLAFATTYEFVTVLDDQKGNDVGFRCVKPAKLVEQELKK